MTFTDAQEMARPAFAQTRTPGLDAVAQVIQRVVSNEQNRLATEVARAEARCLDAENKATKLQRDLAAARQDANRWHEKAMELKLQVDEKHEDAKALAKAFQKCRNGKAFIAPDCLDKYLAPGEGGGRWEK